MSQIAKFQTTVYHRKETHEQISNNRLSPFLYRGIHPCATHKPIGVAPVPDHDDRRGADDPLDGIRGGGAVMIEKEYVETLKNGNDDRLKAIENAVKELKFRLDEHEEQHLTADEMVDVTVMKLADRMMQTYRECISRKGKTNEQT